MRAILAALPVLLGFGACAPIKLAPTLAAASNGAAGESLWALVPGYGLVRGTSVGLAALDAAALDVSGHPAARACRDAIDERAQAYAPARVDVIATSAPVLSRDGASASATIRVLYRHKLTYGVRLASLVCHSDPAGRFLDAAEVGARSEGYAVDRGRQIHR